MTKINNINELNQKLKSNYERECKNYLKKLKTKGYIILVDDSGNKHIWQYNYRAKEYVKSKYTLGRIVDEMEKMVDNSFDVPMEYQEYFTMLEKILPTVTDDELNRWYEYNNALTNIKTEKELKKELKELESVIKNRSRKINITNDDVLEQLQVIVNNGIVSCDVSNGALYRKIRYFKYSKSEQRFKPVSTEEIKELIEKTLEIKLNERLIEKHMKKDWYTYGINSNLPKKWNDNLEYQKTIYENENNKINTIINNYN